MPKMEYVKGVGYVRAGSWSTKSAVQQWRLTQKQLDDAALVMVPRLAYLLFDEGSEYSELTRESYEDQIIWDLEDLRRQIDELLARLPADRKIRALENVAGRTPEEAAAFKAKARELRARHHSER